MGIRSQHHMSDIFTFGQKVKTVEQEPLMSNINPLCYRKINIALWRE